MRRCRVFLAVLLCAAGSAVAQQPRDTPIPSPGGGNQPPSMNPVIPGGPGGPGGSGPGGGRGGQQQQPVAPAIVTVPIVPPQPNGPVQKSLVRITATEVEPDYKAPWNAGTIGRGIGAGFVIEGNRIMTNAHVVSNSRFLTVERDGDPNKYPAQVQFVAHDCDLALITVADKNFFKNMLPLKLGGIPSLESTVSAYGYPLGGERMSVTTGIVSRIDFTLYTHSSIDQHLAVQISAQINPGNSGGPVMQNGKVVGVAFQGYSGDVAQGVAYMIPTPVIQRFLKDVSDGHYDKYVDLGLTYSKLQNAAQRRWLGLKDDEHGVLISTVVSVGPCAKAVQPGDVLMAIDDHAIASDGNVDLDGERVEMPEIVERKFKGDKVKLDIWRDKKPLTATVELDTVPPYLIQGHAYDVRPRYVVYAGLIFQPLNLDLIEAYQWPDLRVRHFFDFFVLEQIFKEHPEVVVLTNILPDPINTYLGAYRGNIVDDVNGQKIRTLADLAKALESPGDRLVINLIGDGPPLVLDPKKVAEARDRIRTRYRVTREQNLEDQPLPMPAEEMNKANGPTGGSAEEEDDDDDSAAPAASPKDSTEKEPGR